MRSEIDCWIFLLYFVLYFIRNKIKIEYVGNAYFAYKDASPLMRIEIEAVTAGLRELSEAKIYEYILSYTRELLLRLNPGFRLKKIFF